MVCTSIVCNIANKKCIHSEFEVINGFVLSTEIGVIKDNKSVTSGRG